MPDDIITMPLFSLWKDCEVNGGGTYKSSLVDSSCWDFKRHFYANFTRVHYVLAKRKIALNTDWAHLRTVHQSTSFDATVLVCTGHEIFGSTACKPILLHQKKFYHTTYCFLNELHSVRMVCFAVRNNNLIVICFVLIFRLNSCTLIYKRNWQNSSKLGGVVTNISLTINVWILILYHHFVGIDRTKRC